MHVAALGAGVRARVQPRRHRLRLLDLAGVGGAEAPGLGVVEPDRGMVRAAVDDPPVAAPRRLELARVDMREAELGQRVRVVRGQGERPFVGLHRLAGPPGVEQRAAEGDPEIGIIGKPLDEAAKLRGRGLRLTRPPERAAEVEAGVHVAGVEGEGGPIGGHRIAGPLPLQEQVPEGSVRGGLLRLARDRPLREREGEPEPAGRTREEGVVQRRAGKLRGGREHLPIARLGGDETPGPMVQGSQPKPLGKAGRRLRPKAGLRTPPLARLRSGGSASHRSESRPAAPGHPGTEWYRMRPFGGRAPGSLSSDPGRRPPPARSPARPNPARVRDGEAAPETPPTSGRNPT